MVQARTSVSPAVRKAHQAEQRIGRRDQPLQARFLQAVAGQIFLRFFGRQLRQLGFDFPADRRHRRVRRPAKGPVRYSSSTSCMRGGVFLADIQHAQHRLLRKELEAANALLIFSAELQPAQGAIRFELGFQRSSSANSCVQLRTLGLLAILIDPLHALFHHHQIAQDQLRSRRPRNRAADRPSLFRAAPCRFRKRAARAPARPPRARLAR